MKHFKTGFSLLILSLASLTVLFNNATSAHRQNEQAKANAREEAYRANNLGVALLEQFKHKEAADAFKRALQLEPSLTLARINLGIALFNIPELPAAQKELQTAVTSAPTAPQPHYVLGLAAKTQNKPDEAIASFQRVLKIDANDVGANVNLGQLYAQQRKYPEAIAVLRIAVAAEPYNATGLYNLGTALMRSGQREEGQKVIAQFQELRQRGTGTTLGTNYLEQGRYAEAIASTGAEPDLVDKRTPEVTFNDATANVIPPVTGWRIPLSANQVNSGAALLFDYDLDGDLDLLEVGGTKQRLCRNDGGKFTDVTAQAGAIAKEMNGAGTGAVAGDYDNDGRPDLFILRSGLSTLYHNDGNGSFSDVTASAKIPAAPEQALTTAFADVDHDGDLDLLIGGQGNLLLRNNGDRTFSDQTAAAKLENKVSARSIVATDFDNRRDIDLLIAANEKTSLWRNMRDGTFRDVAAEVGLGAPELKGKTTVAAGDVNKDGFTDFYLGSPGDPSGFLALSNGKERFQISPAPGNSSAAQFLDYDNDGLLDLVLVNLTGLIVRRNAGDAWIDVTGKPAPAPVTAPSILASGDIDGDGDTDIIYGMPGALKVARNDGGNSNRSVRVNLAGKVSNRSGVGAKLEVRAGSLAQKIETYSASPAPAPADVLFGLGKRTTVDALRVLWPAGIVQAETELANTKSPITLTELDRKPSSCPYLYVWNGERFEFVTDFLGGGEMGHLDAPGIYNTPDPDEYVRISGDLLRERNGRYELRVTNELEEALFLDRLQLLSVAHPKDVEIYPNEGLTVPPQPFKIHRTRDARLPLAAFDEHGHDVLSRIARVDRQYPDDFRLQLIRGYADDHELTMKLGENSTAHGRMLLLLTGWTDYAWSSDNLAASQSGKSLQLPALQVKDKRGRWKTVIENIGIPVGRPQTIVADLTGKFLSASREVRIVTNMRIYWDQILVDTSSGNFPIQLTRLDPSVADLRWRGFSLEHSPDGSQPMNYDYKQVSFASPWKVMTGRYTREGDVRELLVAADDMFVISRPGDELILSFSADKLPPLPNGWTRTFLLYGDGFSKEMDINSASPDAVGPLPFHGMSKYPYTWPERYPLTEKRQIYLEKYNTRIVTSPVERIAGFSERLTESSGLSLIDK